MQKIFFPTLLLLFCTHLGFTQGISEGQIPKDSIRMTVDFEDVVVTAQYAPTDSKNAVQSIRVIDRETIERQGATNLEQLFQQDLSIRISQDLILGSGMSLLGVGGENVKIMVDGVPIIGRLDGNIDLSQINLNNIERIEIVEGPMSVSYGTDALGGVINLITKKSQRYPLDLTLSQQVETRNESVSNVDAGIRFGDQTLLRLNAGRDYFDGFSNDTVRSSLWNPKEQWYVDASLRRDFGTDQQLRYQFSFFDEEVQNLGDVRRPQFKPYAFDDFYLTRRMNHALAHEGTVWEKFYTTSVLGFNDFHRTVNSYRVDFDEDQQTSMSSDSTAFQAWMVRSVFASKFRNSALNFQLGVDLRYEKGTGGRILDENSAIENGSAIGDYAVFGSLRYEPFRDLLLETGLRATQNSRYEAPLIPSVHLKYQLTDALSLRASYAKGFRSPSLKELFLNFIDINHFIIGNPELQAATSDNFQLNLNFDKKYRQHRFTSRAHFFYNNIDDQIQLFPFLEQNGELVPTTPSQSTSYAYFNLAEARIRGVNLNVGYQWKDFQVEAGAQRIYFYNPLSEELPEVERFTPITELNGKVSYLLPLIHSNLSLFVRTNDRFINYFPETEGGQTVGRQQVQDGFTMLDATLNRSFLNDRLQITVGVRNLLDIQQVNLTGGGGGAHSGGSNAPIGTGRSFFVRATFQLFDQGTTSFMNAPIQQQRKQALRLTPGSEETIYASWIENKKEDEPTLQFAEYDGANWTRPKTIATGNKHWFVNAIDAPGLLRFGKSEKSLAAFWLENNNARNAYDHHILMSYSNSGGKNWKKPFRPYESDIPAYYGLLKSAPLSDTRNLLVWMDGRTTKRKLEDSEHYVPTLDGQLYLHSAELNTKGKITNEQPLPFSIATLCPFALAATPKGTLLAFRNTHRQIMLSRYESGQWQPPTLLQEENWAANFPVLEAPAITVQNEAVAVAWYSEADSAAQVNVAFSPDSGHTFSAPFCLAKGRATGKVAAQWLDDSIVLLAFAERQENQNVVSLAVVDKNGKLLHEEQLAASSTGKLQVSPQFAKLDDKLLLAWQWSNGDYKLQSIKWDGNQLDIDLMPF